MPATIPENITELTVYDFSIFRLLIEFIYSVPKPDWFSFEGNDFIAYSAVSPVNIIGV